LKHESITEDGQGTAALYALGALSQHEARAFENHLRDGCEACESELRQFEQVAGFIGATAQEVSPPAYLRDLVASRIEKETLQPQRQVRQSADVIPFPEQARVRRESNPERSGWRVILPWAVAASLLIALAYSIYSWQADRRELQSSVNSLQASVNRSEKELARASQSAREVSEINTVLASQDHRIIPLKGGEVAPSSAANVYWDVQNKRWVVSGDLPPAPAGKAYQLWFITADAKVSAAVMKSDPKGHVFGVVEVPDEITGQIKAVAFTLEPESGSPQPTSAIYAVGQTG
jgi:anti-sigma-K factor RskA